MSTIINGYRLTRELSNENAGMCQWGFAVKDGHEYFIKQFLNPKYPDDTGRLPAAMVMRMRQAATSSFMKRKAFYDRLRECRTGNNVVVEDYFRFGNFYYAVTDLVHGPYLSVEEIAALPDEKKRVLIRAILFNVMQFHDKGIVHSDLKPDNIMVRRTAEGFCTAKIIDFDAGFFSYEPPEEITGDQVYFSPEALLHNMGKETAVTEKADIFALGLLFHQYWTGALPGFDRREHRYANEAQPDRPAGGYPGAAGPDALPGPGRPAHGPPGLGAPVRRHGEGFEDPVPPAHGRRPVRRTPAPGRLPARIR